MKRRLQEEREKQGRWISSHTEEVAMFSERTTDSCTVVIRFARVAAVLVFAPAFLLGVTGTTTQTLSAPINAIGKLSVPSSLNLTSAGTTFVAYAGNLIVSYRIRTTAATGSGSLTMRATADFSPAGGPSIAGGQLTYTCSAASLGVACSGTQTASTASQTSVVTLGASLCTGGGGSCSSANTNSVQSTFTLSNNPAFKTGTYSATLTFTISAI
jgi:hypothetical protein